MDLTIRWQRARSPRVVRSGFRWLGTLALALVLAGCQSDDEKIAAFLANGDEYAEATSWSEAVIEYRNVLQLDPNHAQAHYSLAKAYLELKRGKEAYWELSETVRLDPQNADARMTLGGLNLLGQNFEEALAQAEKAIEIDPTLSQAYILAGQALEQLDRAEEAEAQYAKALAADPDEGPYLLVTAGYYVRQNQREKAEPLLRKYTEIAPGFLSYSSLGRFLAENRGRIDEATVAFQKAIELSTGDERNAGYQNLANYFYALGRTDDAIALLETGRNEVEAGSDGQLDLIYLLARFHRSQGNEALADQLIESATAAQPNSAKPYLILSAYRGRKGDLEGALEAAEAALAIEPENAKGLLRKAELLVDLGYRAEDPARIGQGREIVEQVLAKEPTSPDALFVKGKVELAVSDVKAAIKALRAAIDSRPGWAQAHFVLGSALTLSGDATAARGEMARAVELDPEMIEAKRMLARLHAALGEHEYAVEQGRAYLKSDPDDAKTRILVAQSLVRIGQRDEAEAELDRIPAAKWDAEVYYARARLALGANDTESARKDLLRSAELSPHHPEILGALLALDRGTDRLPATKAMVDAAVAARPDNAEVLRLAGALALVSGDLQAAETHLKKATELDPDNMAAYQQLAALYQASGRLDETLETYQRALAQKPDEPRLHHFVAVLYETGGRVDEAMAEYEKAIELDPNLAQSKNNLAYLLAESGRDLDRALDLAQAAKALMPENGNAADTLGWVLHKRGVSSAAIGYLKEAVATMDPNSASLGIVRHHLAQAYEANDQRAEAIETLEVALADLEQRIAAARAQGAQPVEPEWSAPVREMLSRLKPAG